MKIQIFLIAFIYVVNASFNYLNISDYSNFDVKDVNLDIEDSEIANDLQLFKNTRNQIKKAACFSLIRNSLNDGNDKIRQILTTTKLDKNLSFDKMILLMLDNCNKNINQDDALRFLTPENVLNLEKEYLSLLDFDYEIFTDPFYQFKFTDEEKEILNEINFNQFTEEETNSCQNGLNDFDKYRFIGIGAGSALAFVLFVLILKNLFKSKKEDSPPIRLSDKKKK